MSIDTNVWLKMHYESGQVPMHRIRQTFQALGFDLVAGVEAEDYLWLFTQQAYAKGNPGTQDKSHWEAFYGACVRLGYGPARTAEKGQEDTSEGFGEAPVRVEARSRFATRGQRVRYQVVREGGHVFRPAYEGDVGMDLQATERTNVQPGGITYIPLGVAFAAPAGYWILLLGRSSLAAKMGLAMVPGVIDHGFRGEMLAGVYPIGPAPVLVEKGTRLAQAILMPVVEPVPEKVDWLPPSERGENGFGSSGGHQ